MITWIKTSDYAPNPQDNPDIIIAKRNESQPFFLSHTGFTFELCKGGSQVDSMWNDTQERNESSSSSWFTHSENDLVQSNDFDYWASFDPNKVDWKNHYSDLLSQLPEGYLSLACVVKTQKENNTGAMGQAFLPKEADGDLTLDIIYFLKDDEYNLQATNFCDEPIDVTAEYYYIIPSPE